jgi:hypothetical protein
MPSHEKTRELATKFDEAYPETLPKRLTWWCLVLGVNRLRLLRMMGLSAAEATKQKDTNWTELFRNKEWEENAWWVEGKLHDLLALFDYDWIALADRLHHGTDAQREEPSRVTRQKGDIVKLQHIPGHDGTETLLNQLAKGGPESFPALIAYLAHERSS